MIGDIISDMITINGKDIKRINHALKIYGFAKCIASDEKVDGTVMQTIEIVAVLRDIAIAHCEKTYGKCTGKMQELHGPAVAMQILDNLDISEACKTRVCYLIAHHHTYEQIDGIDYRILIEADFLVNHD